MNAPEEKDPIAELLAHTAAQIQPDFDFVNNLEKKLKMEHSSKQERSRQIWNTLGRIAAFAAVAAVMVWLFNSTRVTRGGDDSQPQPAAGDETSLPQQDNSKPQYGQYPFRTGTLSLAVPLPDAPAALEVYTLNEEPPATVEDVLELARRFNIDAPVYESIGTYPGTTDYVVSDGRQWLAVHSKNSFYYTADMVKNGRSISLPDNGDAPAIIGDYLKAHGFDFAFDLEPSNSFGSYIVRPLTPNGIPMQFETYSVPMMQVKLDENGNVLAVDSSLVAYQQSGSGAYGIISAEEALQVLLDDTVVAGKIESMSSGGIAAAPYRQWFREYADGEPAILFGSLTIARSLDASQPALLLVDNVPVLGNTAGLEALADYAFVRMDGTYTTENGIRKFIVNEWMENDPSLTYLTGSLSGQPGSAVLTTDQGLQYTLASPLPADVPFNTSLTESSLSMNGRVLDGDRFEWTYIQFFEDASQMGGGGGGGGYGFYSLNLSGTPIPFPTATPIPDLTVDENSLTYLVVEGDTPEMLAAAFGMTREQLLNANRISEITVGQSISIPNTQKLPALQGVRGMLNILVFTKEDGSVSKTVYNFIPSDPQYPYMELTGDDLEALNAYNNLPLLVWGSADQLNRYGTYVLKMETYEIPYPDAAWQIYKGTERSLETPQGGIAIFTTEDGAEYAVMSQTCVDPFSPSGALGKESKETGQIQVEGLILPDVTYENYPVMCVYSSAPADAGFELTLSSNLPNEIPDYQYENLGPQDLTIESIELIYYTANPRMLADAPAAQFYMQPVWSFSGHYANGASFNALIQALKPEFLDPVLAPYVQPG